MLYEYRTDDCGNVFCIHERGAKHPREVLDLTRGKTFVFGVSYGLVCFAVYSALPNPVPGTDCVDLNFAADSLGLSPDELVDQMERDGLVVRIDGLVYPGPIDGLRAKR